MIEGYLVVFISSLLAATVIPFSSEAVLAGFVTSGAFSSVALWATASAGNTLGACVNWLLGRWFLHWSGHRWFPFSSPQIDRATRFFDRYGAWILLLSWVPLIGDPLTFVAGMLRMAFPLFVAVVFVGKAARYAVIVMLAANAFD